MPFEGPIKIPNGPLPESDAIPNSAEIASEKALSPEDQENLETVQEIVRSIDDDVLKDIFREHLERSQTPAEKAEYDLTENIDRYVSAEGTQTLLQDEESLRTLARYNTVSKNITMYAGPIIKNAELHLKLMQEPVQEHLPKAADTLQKLGVAAEAAAINYAGNQTIESAKALEEAEKRHDIALVEALALKEFSYRDITEITKQFRIVTTFIHEQLHAITNTAAYNAGFSTKGVYTGFNEAMTEQFAQKLAQEYLHRTPPDAMSSYAMERFFAIEKYYGPYDGERKVYDKFIALLSALSGVPESTVEDSMAREYLRSGSFITDELLDTYNLAIDPEEKRDSGVIKHVANHILSQSSYNADSFTARKVDEFIHDITKTLSDNQAAIFTDRLAEIETGYSPDAYENLPEAPRIEPTESSKAAAEETRLAIETAKQEAEEAGLAAEKAEWDKKFVKVLDMTVDRRVLEYFTEKQLEQLNTTSDYVRLVQNGGAVYVMAEVKDPEQNGGYAVRRVELENGRAMLKERGFSKIDTKSIPGLQIASDKSDFWLVDVDGRPLSPEGDRWYKDVFEVDGYIMGMRGEDDWVVIDRETGTPIPGAPGFDTIDTKTVFGFRIAVREDSGREIKWFIHEDGKKAGGKFTKIEADATDPANSTFFIWHLGNQGPTRINISDHPYRGAVGGN